MDGLTTTDFVTYLASQDIILWVEDDRLRYRSPAGSITPELRAELRARKADLLAFLRAITPVSTTAPPLQPQPRPVNMPLAFAQERLWFLDRWMPGSPAYNIPEVLHLRGQLDPERLGRCFNLIIERHEALRTTFDVVDDTPVQVIHLWNIVPLPLIDLQPLPAAERDAQVVQLAQAEAQRPFDLQRGPLVRVTLLRLDPIAHVLLLTLHHIIADGWSMNVLVRELVTLYQSADPATALPPLPLQYADYTLWQRAWLQGPVLDQQLAYWRQQLADAPPRLDLPTDRPRPAQPTYRGASYAVQLDAPLTSALRQLSQTHGVTLFMTLLAAWQTLLARLSGQSDIVVGTSIAGRTAAALEDLIGFFVNTLVLRTDLSDNPTVLDLLRRVQDGALGAYSHQDIPFAQVVEVIRPERSQSYTPLFQVMFALQNTPPPQLEMPDMQFSLLTVEAGTAKYDLTLLAVEDSDVLGLTIEYNTDLFEAATMARLAGQFEVLLRAFVAQPYARIHTLPLLPEAERQQVMVAWNSSSPPPLPATCVHQLVELQVARTPHHPAVQDPAQTLTYHELDRRANQLAQALQQRGVGPDRCVGVCLARAADLVVALLAVLKAGATYLPLDPAYPTERLAYVLRDADALVIVTQQPLLALLPSVTCPTICLDRDAPQLAQQLDTPPSTAVCADHLAYIIYTSGSTGRPKGVAIPHAAAAAHLLTFSQTLGLTPHDRVLQFASPSFDVSIEQMLAPLLAGATVVLPGAQLWTLSELSAHIATDGLTVINLPPAYWQQWLHAWIAAGHRAPPAPLRLIIVGGEALPLAALQLWQTTSRTGVRLLNAYGPTETTITATVAELAAAQDGALAGPSAPIGRPLAGRRAYVLDAELELVPIGVAGELYLGGTGLARGYLHDAALTAARFVPDPWSTEPSQRLYATGDRARIHADGTIAFVGRSDAQVKLRGFRIELGEIEAALEHHPQVRAAVVLARAESAAEQRLVAYIVAEPRAARHDPADPDDTQGAQGAAGLDASGELHVFLQRRLPAYMLPAAYIVLPALPLTATGKIDRRALPAPDTARPTPDSAYVAPRDPWEHQLVALWEALFATRPIGVTENFFTLGGHSLLAVRAAAQIEQRFGQALPLTVLFQAPTIAQLAAYLRQPQAAAAWSPLVALQPSGTRRPFFCIHPVGGTVACYAELARTLGPDQPFYALQARGLDPDQVPHTQIATMAAEYLRAIRAVQPRGPYLLGGWSLGGSIAFELGRQLQEQHEEVQRLVLLDSYAPDPAAALPDDATLVAAFAHDLGNLFGQPLTVSAAELDQVPPAEQLELVLSLAQQRQILPTELQLDQIKRMAQVFEANLRAFQRYTPPLLRQHVTLLQASESADDGQRLDQARTWQMLVHRPISSIVVPGTHYTMLQSPQVAVVAKCLRELLAAAEQETA